MFVQQPFSPGTGGASTVVFTVNVSEIIVMGLTPGADYTFSVTAENAVSSQDMNITDRTVNISATTEEGGNVVCNLNKEYSVHVYASNYITHGGVVVHCTLVLTNI